MWGDVTEQGVSSEDTASAEDGAAAGAGSRTNDCRVVMAGRASPATAFGENLATDMGDDAVCSTVVKSLTELWRLRSDNPSWPPAVVGCAGPGEAPAGTFMSAWPLPSSACALSSAAPVTIALGIPASGGSEDSSGMGEFSGVSVGKRRRTGGGGDKDSEEDALDEDSRRSLLARRCLLMVRLPLL